MRIEEFLFNNDIEEAQAESLIVSYPNLIFNTSEQFFSFFENKGIRLFKKRTSDGYPEKSDLLEKFKSFKSSLDYATVKKFIATQRKIKLAIDLGDIDKARNLSSDANIKNIDPFFNFIVRKMLTGSDSGVLPSEELQKILDDLLKKQETLNIKEEVLRDSIDRIISNKNYLKNKGSIKIQIQDERYSVTSFNYIIPTAFNETPDAINAEKNVLSKAKNLEMLNLEDLDEAGLVDALKDLILTDSSSPAAANLRVEELQKQLEELQELLNTKDQDNANLQNIIDELAVQRENILQENISKDETIAAMTETMDSVLADLQDKVSDQLSNTADAFDALSDKLDKQAEKQLEAFNKIADAFAPPSEPTPSEGNPAKDIIIEIFTELDKLMLIPNTKYAKFVEILNELEVKKKPSKYEYVYAPPANRNKYRPSEEVNQHLNWNNKYKTDYKKLLIEVTDKDKATRILNSVKDILKDPNCINNKGLIDTISDALNAWSSDYKESRGIGGPIVKKIALQIGADDDWNVADDNAPSRSEAIAVARAIIKKLPNDGNELLNIIKFLSEIKNDKGW